jgi:hypothetical protein
MPILDDVILKLYTFWYNLLYLLAAAHWGLMRGVFMMGYTIELLTQWMTTQAFSPLIQQTGDSLRVATSLAFVFALVILGVTYLIASIVRLDIVSPRNAILWYFAGVLFFSVGPSLYQGMNDFRRTVSSAFYLSVLNTLQGQTGSVMSSLNGVKSPDLGILKPCDNFGPYLGKPGGGGVTVNISGLDIALAYLRADGIDVMGYPYPTSDSCQAHVPPQSFPIPWEWQRPNSYFDNTKGPAFFPTMTEEQRQQAIDTAGSSQWRLFSAWPLVWFGVFEQITALCLTIAQGLTFISFACVILFAFFKRTEGIAWSLLDQWLALIVQAVVIAMIQALVVSFFLAGAATNNGLVVVGIGLICLVFMAILLWSGIKAIWRSFNGLFDAVSKATGGVMVSPGAALQTAAAAGAAVATGGMSLAGNALGGASALMNGASWAQAAGVALGESQTLTRAARMVTRLPGLRDSELEEVADHFVEGAATRQVARNIPAVGHVIGPVVGAALLSDRNPDHAYEDEEGRFRQPMLVPAVGSVLSGLTQGPRWKRKRHMDEVDDVQEGGFTPVAPVRMGMFTPIAPVPANGETRDINADDIASRQRSDYVMQEGGEEMEQHIAEVVGSRFPTSRTGEADAARLDSASSRLERAADQAGDRLGRAAEGLERAARQQQMQSFEGRLNVAGPAQVAGTMGDVIALLQAHKGSESLKGVDNFTLAGTMAQALGVTPVENGKPPIENDLARFGVFANQALTMGLNSEQTERVVREVKESPEASLQPDTRAELVGQMHTERNLSWDDANQEVDRLEHSARLLPNEMSAYGVMSVPSASPAAPVVTVEPQVDLRPNVQVTVETPQDSAYAQGLQEQAPLTGSEAMLTSDASTDKEGEEV